MDWFEHFFKPFEYLDFSDKHLAREVWYAIPAPETTPPPYKPFLTAQDLRYLRDMGVGTGIKLQEPEDA